LLAKRRVGAYERPFWLIEGRDKVPPYMTLSYTALSAAGSERPSGLWCGAGHWVPITPIHSLSQPVRRRYCAHSAKTGRVTAQGAADGYLRQEEARRDHPPRDPRKWVNLAIG